MTKRTLLYWIAVVVVVLTYLVAAGADADIGSRSECVGLASLAHWLDGDCKAALVPRLLILVVGAVPTFILIYFAGKDRARSPVGGGHYVNYGWGFGLCEECDFIAHSREEVHQHQAETAKRDDDSPASLPEPANAYGLTTPTVPVAGSDNTPPESQSTVAFKVCPDCAEEVRTAARKCRFCGYIFDGTAALS